MTPFARPAVLAAALLLTACQMAPAQPAVPALLTNPGAEVRQELSAAIQALGGFSSVALADSDLTRSSELVMERLLPLEGRAERWQGRDLQLPQRFQLLTRNGECWLLHIPSGQRRRLLQAQCRVQ